MRSFCLAALFAVTATAVLAQSRPDSPPAKVPGPAVSADSSAGSIPPRVEMFLRKLYAWGPAFQVKIEPLRDAAVPGFYEVHVDVTIGEQSDSAVVFVGKDGRYILRGDMQDMTADPLAAIRGQIHLAESPSRGPDHASVVVVEYSDFQCPTCGQLYKVMHELEPRYPQVRFVHKDFPLTQIHPWALTAAIAGRCAYLQNHDSFWKVHDSIFESQQVISAENVWQKMQDFAAKAGLDPESLRACMASPEAKQAVVQSVKEGQELKVANTPTVFVNGRRMIGADRVLLEQFLQYELASHPSSPSVPKD